MQFYSFQTYLISHFNLVRGTFKYFIVCKGIFKPSTYTVSIVGGLQESLGFMLQAQKMLCRQLLPQRHTECHQIWHRPRCHCDVTFGQAFFGKSHLNLFMTELGQDSKLPFQPSFCRPPFLKCTAYLNVWNQVQNGGSFCLHSTFISLIITCLIIISGV